jgi:3-hydroxypropanoate dehydrogenase
LTQAALQPARSTPVAGDTLDRLFRTARSYKRWHAGSIPEHLLRELYELVALGPTSANCSPARFVFVRSPEGRSRLADCVDSGNRIKVLQAPVTVVVGMDLDFRDHMGQLFPHNPAAGSWFSKEAKAHDTAFRNSSLQGAYLIIAARALGLDCGPLSGFSHERVDAAFFPGGRVRSNFLCCLGRGTEEELFPRLPRLSFEQACRFE